MEIGLIVVMTFLLIGTGVLGAALWSVYYPKLLCQAKRNTHSEYNICIRIKNHDGPHMAADGGKF
tara:strand:+ start:28575 stop:28769 length:195 start_codon:yes stop_codon:yes gene_type:complete